MVGPDLAARGRVLQAIGQEVRWIVVLKPLPYQRLGVDDCARLEDGAPVSLGDCGVVLHLENMMLEHDDDLVAAPDLASACPDERRKEVLAEVTTSLAAYVPARGTVERLRASYAAGEFRSAFIRAETRGSLERPPTERMPIYAERQLGHEGLTGDGRGRRRRACLRRRPVGPGFRGTAAGPRGTAGQGCEGGEHGG